MSIEIKICGINTTAALEAAVAAGADIIGLVLFPPSPRAVSIIDAADLARAARGRVRIATLTVDGSPEALDEIAREIQPDIMQLHGGETPQYISALRSRFGGEIWKAIAIASSEDVAAVAAYSPVTDRLLFDAKPPSGATRPGGNAHSFDWSILSGLDLAKPFVLSGGLTADNVGRAISETHTAAVDVSSGVEHAPGLKDPDKIHAFVRAVRMAAEKPLNSFAGTDQS